MHSLLNVELYKLLLLLRGLTTCRWVDMVLIAGADETACKLKSCWESQMTAASLTATMAFAGIFCAPTVDDEMSRLNYVLRQIYVVAMTASFILALLSTSTATMLLTRPASIV